VRKSSSGFYAITVTGRWGLVARSKLSGRFGCEAEYCFMQSGELVKRGA
jgi:hypothetical protein